MKKATSIIIIVLTLALPFFVNWLTTFGNVNTNNDWIGFFGGYFGAIIGGIITGLVAYGIALFQVRKIERDQKVESINKFLMTYHVIYPSLERLIVLLDKGSEHRAPLYSLMISHLERETQSKEMGNTNAKDSRLLFALASKDLSDIVEVREEIKEIGVNINELRDEYISLCFYGEYIKLKQTLNKILKIINTFLFHDDLIPKNEIEKVYNFYHDMHSNNNVIQHKLAHDKTDFVRDVYKIKSELEALYQRKTKEKEKLNLGYNYFF
ncbi:hypothetical protein [Halobacillus yeomjeoni]|uniref:Phage abortive infection protein n=1 Tax=Halobacillus yeomjeoni TaxID=311194 RepID=A0A931HTJ8_9BACI|nr:hypothetical protein [Halobacillus yeomjeoni]MBH0229532.1 hypothetical protein [Halobacillus yeomjeoni]